MKYIILPIFILIGSIVGCQQQSNNETSNSSDSIESRGSSIFTFQKYLKSQDLRQHADSLYNSKQFASALEAYKECQNASYSIASCYIHLGDQEQALANLQVAFSNGYRIEHVDQDLFSPIWTRIEKSYPEYRKKYYASVDTVLYNELYEMQVLDQKYRKEIPNCNDDKSCIDSIWRLQTPIDKYNNQRLKEITSENGWLGTKLIGSDVIKIVDPTIIVAHVPEADQLYFLDKAIEQAEKGKAHWADPGNIVIQFFIRHDENGVYKLRKTYSTPDGKLDLDSSAFQLYHLSKFMNDNPGLQITLHSVYYPHKDDKKDLNLYKSTLEEIKNYIIKQGISKERVVVSDQVIEGTPDEFESYRFVFTRS